MPYSLDLRKRVIDSINNGMNTTEAARVFNVARRTIYDWKNLQKQTGSLKAKTGYQKGHSHKIKDWEMFRRFVEANKQYQGPRMIEELEKQTGIKVSDPVLYRALKKIGYTSKKNLFLRRSN